ncbi:MAG: hypothetical protein PHW60_05090 [Kiritimatiellae bacterium]|nr:hypothetical protein [Kiritimatiellia bacterium]
MTCISDPFGFDSASWARSRLRYEAFWKGEPSDRPLLQVRSRAPGVAAAPTPGDIRPREPEALFRWYMDPDCVIPRLAREIERTYYAGDAFPCVFPVSCAVVAIQAAYLGGRYRIAPDSGSGWCDPSINDWAARAELAVDPENIWWRRTRELLEAGSKAFEGRAAVGIPDIQGGGQILASLRGTEELAMDLVDHPDEIRRALEEVDRTWRIYWSECNSILLRRQNAYVDWLGVWSDQPAVTTECDFSIMISADMFKTFFVPSLLRQTSWVDRTIYHLDGAGAIRHLDALLAIDKLTGIQWVPGAGAAPMSTWLPLLKRIQDAGKRLVISCKAEELEALVAALQPRGLCISTSTRTPEEAEALVGRVA